MGMKKMIEVPLREYEELVRDSEKLRIIAEMAMRASKDGGRKAGLSLNNILLIAGYWSADKESVCSRDGFSDKPVAPAQIKPEVHMDNAKIAKRISEAMNGIHFQINGGMTNE